MRTSLSCGLDVGEFAIAFFLRSREGGKRGRVEKNRKALELIYLP
jgi:hypothetical protein